MQSCPIHQITVTPNSAFSNSALNLDPKKGSIWCLTVSAFFGFKGQIRIAYSVLSKELKQIDSESSTYVVVVLT